MPLAINTKTGIIRELPLNIINHRILGKHLELYVPAEDEVEEDKVVIAKKVYPRKKSEAPAEDITNIEESTVTDFEDGE